MSKEEKRINDRMDTLQKLPPTQEVAEEYCALLKQLRELSPSVQPPHPAVTVRQLCYELRWMIWIEAIVLCWMALFIAPDLLNTDMCEGAAGIILIMGAIASLALAIWSSGYRRK